MTVAVLGVTDHPADYAATETTAGVAYAPLDGGVPAWLTEHIERLSRVHDAVLVTPHWGPNMTTAPSGSIRRAAERFLRAGATLVAGHSAHVFHGVAERVIYDLGDFVDDYARDPERRNDLGLLWTATLHGRVDLEAQPLHLGYAHTQAADEEERAWIRTRLTEACREFGTEVTAHDGHLSVSGRD